MPTQPKTTNNKSALYDFLLVILSAGLALGIVYTVNTIPNGREWFFQHVSWFNAIDFVALLLYTLSLFYKQEHEPSSHTFSIVLATSILLCMCTSISRNDVNDLAFNAVMFSLSLVCVWKTGGTRRQKRDNKRIEDEEEGDEEEVDRYVSLV